MRPAVRQILFVTRLPPNADGTGGVQRPMQVLRALAKLGAVDLLILHREGDCEAAEAPSAKARALVRTWRRLEIADWAPSTVRWPALPWKLQQLVEFAVTGAIDAPRFGQAALNEIADVLAQPSYDVIFAERLSSAVIVDQLVRRHMLGGGRFITDLDDISSTLKQRELVVKGRSEGQLRHLIHRLTIRRLRAAEIAICRTWSAVGLPVAHEIDDLKRLVPTANLHLLPNIVDKPRLGRATIQPERILFVGHLGYYPNIQGLQRFLAESWPIICAALPRARLDVVGMYPDAATVRMVEAAGGVLHANVPSVAPYYAKAEVVVSPIYVASGTRIKIIEALAYGRPVVSTSNGAEGLAIQSGTHALIADDMSDFAEAVVRLCLDPLLAEAIADDGHGLQQTLYSPLAMERAVRAMFDPADAEHA